MNEIFLLKLGEIVLKGANRFTFENKLKGNIRRRMKYFGEFDVYIRQSKDVFGYQAIEARSMGNYRRKVPSSF